MRMLLQKRAEWVCLGVGLLALAVRLALLPVRAIPQPTVQDEFAYLLGAEAVCLGRVRAWAVRRGLRPVGAIPQQTVQDEFAYRRGAERFCLGGVTTPPHPMWV